MKTIGFDAGRMSERDQHEAEIAAERWRQASLLRKAKWAISGMPSDERD